MSKIAKQELFCSRSRKPFIFSRKRRNVFDRLFTGFPLQKVSQNLPVGVILTSIKRGRPASCVRCFDCALNYPWSNWEDWNVVTTLTSVGGAKCHLRYANCRATFDSLCSNWLEWWSGPHNQSERCVGGSCDWEANSIGKFLGGENSFDDDGLFGKFMMVFKKGKIMFFFFKSFTLLYLQE